MLQDEMMRFRAENNLSQEKSAKMAGITLQTWNQVELGRQTPSRLTETKIRFIIERRLNNGTEETDRHTE